MYLPKFHHEAAFTYLSEGHPSFHFPYLRRGWTKGLLIEVPFSDDFSQQAIGPSLSCHQEILVRDLDKSLFIFNQIETFPSLWEVLFHHKCFAQNHLVLLSHNGTRFSWGQKGTGSNVLTTKTRTQRYIKLSALTERQVSLYQDTKKTKTLHSHLSE